ncbi:MAG: Uma2 family endonuclease, partial [Limnospira maxima]
DKIDVCGWIRTENQLTLIDTIKGWISPRLGVRFEMSESGLELYRPDGRKFSTYIELDNQRQQAEERANRLAERLRELGIDPDAM